MDLPVLSLSYSDSIPDTTLWVYHTGMKKFDKSVLSSLKQKSAFAIELESEPTGVIDQEISVASFQIKVIESNKIAVSIPMTTSIQIYSISGKMIRDFGVIQKGSSILSTNGLSCGVYVLKAGSINTKICLK